MKKSLYFSILVTAMFSAHAYAADVSLSMGFVDPISSSYAKGGLKFAEEVKKLTDGRVEINVIAGGSLGGEREMIEGVQMGTVDIGTAANPVFSQFIPEMVLLDQPYLFSSVEEAHKAIDGKLNELIETKAEAQGMRILGWLESGYRDVFSKDPVTKPEDFKGLKIRTMENKMQIAAFNALGAVATPMPFTEQYTALQQGTISANENAICNMLINRYYEVIKNITRTNHQFTYIGVAISERAWQSIPEQDRPKVMEAMKTAVAWQRNDLAELNAFSEKELTEKHGVKFHDIDRKALRDIIVPRLSNLTASVPQEWKDAVAEASKE
ncbi:MAG: TRAP transporter substrate-binding protein [Succinatimonas hippei]|nr:TRAP transporter substrate-binding protein [Succinatimonas hippei]